ncbi:MAG: hypothetical protein ACM3XO_09180 [Bacteroidota bacterium]|jgi:hypothetical protein
MNNNKDESLLFASETAIFRVASIARIVSWVILVIYLILFIDNIKPLFQGQMQWPAAAADWITMVANIFFAPTMGLFYFLVMQGVAQGLNLGLDIFYGLHPDEEEEVVVVEEK